MLNLDKPVQTKDGRKVRMICTDRKGPYPLVGLTDPGEEWLHTWTKDGKFYKDSTEPKPTDLINAPETHVYWMNIYQDRSCNLYPTKEDANTCESEARIACIKIEWEDGDGLERRLSHQ